MAAFQTRRARSDVVLLLSPDSTMVADLFRGVAVFQTHYDTSGLDVLERHTATRLGARAARLIVSDALLLVFGLRSAGVGPWRMRAVGTRIATIEEYCLVGLVAAVAGRRRDLAELAIGALGGRLDGNVASLCEDVGAKLTRRGLVLACPDERLLPSRVSHVPRARPVSAVLRNRAE